MFWVQLFRNAHAILSDTRRSTGFDSLELNWDGSFKYGYIEEIMNSSKLFGQSKVVCLAVGERIVNCKRPDIL